MIGHFHRQASVLPAVTPVAPSIWRIIMPSFDVVSELDKHEVTNAVDNAIKDLDRRYDLRGKGTFEFKEKTVTLDEMKKIINSIYLR